jgi:hypothetical protein
MEGIDMSLEFVRRAMVGSALLLTVSCSPLAMRAQGAQTYGGSKYLVIQREVTKPGRDGSPHEATEAAYMRAAQAGKAPFHYVAMESMSGPNRALFLSGYPTLAAMEAEHKSMSAALQTSLDKAMVADGDLLSEQSGSVWVVDPELSQNTNGPRVGSRYMIVREYVVKPGHEGEWNELVKLVIDGYKKADVGAHWSTYRLVFGNSTGPTFLVLTSIPSLSEVDQMFDRDPKFAQAVGEDGLKRLDTLEAACVESSMSNIFSIDPKMSLPTDEMVKAEPDFWRPKAPAAATAKKTAAPAKPAATSGQ